MKIVEYISEITKPVGAIYLRFKVRMGDVPPNASREEKRKSLYLTAFTGFANDPKELTAANARLRFMKLNSMNDIVKMIKEIMGDKTFISAKSMTIYMDLPNSAYSTFPYLSGFMDWVSKNGGDRIKVEFKPEGEGEEDPLKKKRKPNPNKDLKQVDYDPADPRYTIHFTVSDRFYDAIRKSMPNLMQYKGSGQDFRMPKELFDKFRDAAKQRYGDIGLKILKKAHTAESLEEGANTLFAVKVVDPKTGNEKTIEISALTASEAKSKVAGKWVEVDGEKKHYKVVSVKSAWDDSVDEDITDEAGPANRSLCLSKKSNSQLGASQLASCKSQGLRAREGDKSHKFKDGKRVKVGGHKIKGKAHGGPLPDWGTRGAKKN
jgi:hypothetical protein